MEVINKSSIPVNLNRFYTQWERKLIDNFKKENDHVCAYCKEHIENECDITVDHKTPVSRGGMTIVKNLCIACRECNMEKDCLTEDEYKYYLVTKDEEYRKNIQDMVEKHDITGYVKDENYKVKNVNIANITIPKFLKHSRPSAKKFKMKKNFFEKNGHFLKSVVLDQNNVLLDGYINYLVCKRLNISSVECVILKREEIEITACGA